MGHRAETDFDGLRATAINAWAVAQEHIFPGGAGELLRTLPALTVVAPSFEVCFQLQDDVWDAGNSECRTPCALRFRRRGDAAPDLDAQNVSNTRVVPVSEDFPWTVLLRGDWPERADRLPKAGRLGVRRLRKAISAERRLDAPGPPVFNVETVYVMAKTPPQDLTAQIVLFAL